MEPGALRHPTCNHGVQQTAAATSTVQKKPTALKIQAGLARNGFWMHLLYQSHVPVQLAGAQESSKKCNYTPNISTLEEFYDRF